MLRMTKAPANKKVHQGFRIKKLVERNGMSIVDFAKKTELSEQHMHRLFKQQYIPTKWLTKMCAILDINIEDMFNEVMVANEPFEPYKTKVAEFDKLQAEVLSLKERLKDKEKTISILEALVESISGKDRIKSKAS